MNTELQLSLEGKGKSKKLKLASRAMKGNHFHCRRLLQNTKK